MRPPFFKIRISLYILYEFTAELKFTKKCFSKFSDNQFRKCVGLLQKVNSTVHMEPVHIGR